MYLLFCIEVNKDVATQISSINKYSVEKTVSMDTYNTKQYFIRMIFNMRVYIYSLCNVLQFFHN